MVYHVLVTPPPLTKALCGFKRLLLLLPDIMAAGCLTKPPELQFLILQFLHPLNYECLQLFVIVVYSFNLLLLQKLFRPSQVFLFFFLLLLFMHIINLQNNC